MAAEEISVLLDWVQNGGSLLMVIEHIPFGDSYEALASAFGIKVSNGFAVAGIRDFSGIRKGERQENENG